jgi:hypothetical protein
MLKAAKKQNMAGRALASIEPVATKGGGILGWNTRSAQVMSRVGK